MVKVSVKWNKENYDDVEVTGSFDELKALLFSLTNVPPERQKLMVVRGKMIKSDDDLKSVKDGAKLMLMGTADVLVEPAKPVVFAEDLNDKQKAEMGAKVAPAGLQNLGNTCYMNSTLQCLRAVPELKEALNKQSNNSGPYSNLVNALGGLFRNLDSSSKPVVPYLFTQYLRSTFPQFDETDEKGHHKQQDADECLSQLLMALAAQVKVQDGGKEVNVVDKLFTGEFTSKMTCPELPDQPASVTVEKFHKLRCPIDEKTNYMIDGIKSDLTTVIEKNAPSLGRNVEYQKVSEISKLPQILVVQFVRFMWRRDTNKKAKILRKVVFPDKLDIAPFCESNLRASMQAARLKLREEEEKKQGLLKLLQKKEGDADPHANVPLPTDSSGNYELFGVITHKGRIAEAGHYVGWARQQGDKWLKYDDDIVTEATTEEVKNLCGGGDWHMSYLCMYRRIDDLKDKKWDEAPATTAAAQESSSSSPSQADSSRQEKDVEMTPAAQGQGQPEGSQ